MLLRTLLMVAGVMLCLCTGCGRRDKPAVIPDKDKPKEEPEAVAKTAPKPGAEPEPQIVKSVDVWCFPEYHRIDPVTGDVAEFGFKPVTAAFRQKNDVYDAATNTVSLVAMKGETVPFQIMVEGDHSGVTMEPQGFSCKVKLYYEGYLHWYDKRRSALRHAPDVAVPLDWIGGTFSVADVPEQLPAIEGKAMQAVWVDVIIPRDRATGTIRGKVTVSAAGTVLSEVAINVNVLDVIIPEQPTYLNAMIHYGFGRKHPEVEMDAYRQMQAHRLSIHDIPYSSQRGWGYEGVVPRTTLSPAYERYDEFRKKAMRMSKAERQRYEYLPAIARLKDPRNHTVRGDDLVQRFNELMPLHDLILRECIRLYERDGAGVTDWTTFDRRYGPLFDGSAFEDGVPIASFELPFNFNWPAPLDNFEIMNPQQSRMYEDIWVKVAQDFVRHANEKGWTRTQFFVYFNPKDRGNNLVMWKGDEPCEKNDFLGHRYFNALFWKAFKDPGKVKVDHKIEIGHWECDAVVCRKRFSDSKTWDEDNAREMLKSFHVWMPNSRHYHSARHIAWKQMEEQGDVFYTYGGMATYDQTSMAVYGIAFQGFEDRTRGYAYYIPGYADLAAWRDNPGMKITRTKYASPDDNTAHYQSAIFGRDDSMLMSLRLKALRGVEQHYAAFKAAEAKDSAFAEDLKRRMVKYVVASGGRDKGSTQVVNNNNPHDLYVARLNALAIASGSAPPAGGLKYAGPLKGVKARTDTFHYCIACGEACGPVKCEWCGALQTKPGDRSGKPEPAPPGARTVVLQQGQAGYAGCRDVYIDMARPVGRDDRLELECNGRGGDLQGFLIEFEIPADKVPPTARVSSATLVLQCMRQSRAGGTAKVFALGGTWQKPIAYPAAELLAGREVSTVSFEEYRTGGKTNIDPPKPVRIDVTKAVRDWVPDRRTNHGLLVVPVRTDAVDLRFHSCKADKAAHRPQLEIVYSE